MARAILVLRAFLLLEHEEKLAHGLGWEKETIVWFDLVAVMTMMMSVMMMSVMMMVWTLLVV